LAELFYLSTLGGATAMGLDHKIGNFKVGKQFDALMINPNCGDNIDLFDHDDALSAFEKFIFLGDDRNIGKVFVNGRQVYPF